jgi:hypothetical protein
VRAEAGFDQELFADVGFVELEEEDALGEGSVGIARNETDGGLTEERS